MFKDGSKATGGKYYSQSAGLKNHIRRLYKYTCQICGGYGDQVDHIIPYRLSHDSTLANLRVLCRSCNQLTRLPQHNALPDLDTWYAQLLAIKLFPNVTTA